MKAKDSKKLQKALKKMQEAQALIAEVAESDSKFRYSSNSNFRNNRVNAAVMIVETEVNEFCK